MNQLQMINRMLWGGENPLLLELLSNTNGNTNETWIDTSVYSTNATQSILANRPILTNDRFGVGNKGYVFDGSNDYMVIPDSDRFSFTDNTTDRPFSIEISFKFNSVSNAWFVNKRSSSTNLEWQLNYGEGAWRFYLYDTDYLHYINCYYNITPIVGYNYILKATYDGSGVASGLKLYQNGVLLNTINVNSGTLYPYYSMKNSASIINIGRFGQGGYNLNGDIEYVKIWKGVV